MIVFFVYSQEIYLNEKGVVCERFVTVKEATPGVSKLKRSNSEVCAITESTRIFAPNKGHY